MVEQEEGEFHSALLEVIADTYKITPSRSAFPDVDEDGEFIDFIDCIYYDANTVYYAGARERLNMDDIARALLAKRLMELERREGIEVVFVMLAKRVPRRVMDIAATVGIDVIQLDVDFPLPTRKTKSRNRISKLSHPRSWQIVTRLLWSGPSSIRRLSRIEGVSYSWTHATVTRLIEMGVAERQRTGVRIVDIDRLMDGISWERPLNQLLVEEIPVASKDYMEAARELEALFNDWKVEHAFTAFTAAGVYTGHSQRFDRVYTYMEQDGLDELKRMIADKDGETTVMVYRSDRDHIGATVERDGLTLASPSLTLLDLIGLGYKARTLSREMVSLFENASHE
jgi:hypothetical protein